MDKRPLPLLLPSLLLQLLYLSLEYLCSFGVIVLSNHCTSQQNARHIEIVQTNRRHSQWRIDARRYRSPLSHTHTYQMPKKHFQNWMGAPSTTSHFSPFASCSDTAAHIRCIKIHSTTRWVAYRLHECSTLERGTERCAQTAMTRKHNKFAFFFVYFAYRQRI